MNIADSTGNRWIIAFNDDAEKILGMSAQELGKLKENDNDAYMQKLNEANFKRFIFTVRVKSEVFQVSNSCILLLGKIIFLTIFSLLVILFFLQYYI